MGAQTVSQISGFYTGRYFADDHVKDYAKVPDMIKKVNRDKIMSVARDFIEANTTVMAAVSSGDRDEVIALHDQLAGLFPAEQE